MFTQNLRTWLYLETQSLQMQLVMLGWGHTRLKWALHPKDGALTRREADTQKADTRWKGNHHVKTKVKTKWRTHNPTNIRSCQQQLGERHATDSPLGHPKGTNFANILIWDFWPHSGSVENKFLLFSVQYSSVQFISVAQSCPTLYDPMNCSTPGLPVHHQLLEFIQTHILSHQKKIIIIILMCPRLGG